MFDVSWSELLVIAVAALIFIKPKDLPAAMRAVGQWTGTIRRMASEFQDQFREAMREAEMADLKKDIDEATGKLGSGLDPFAGIKDAVEEWKPSETSTTPVAPPSADAPPAPPAEATTAEPAHIEPAHSEPAHGDAPAPQAAPASAPAVTSETTPAPATAPPAGGDRAA
jgi:sec-independent protein translocase protein TatB